MVGFRKKYKPYVPKYLPPQPKKVTWGFDSRDLIIKLFKRGFGIDDICRQTRNRRFFVESIIQRYEAGLPTCRQCGKRLSHNAHGEFYCSHRCYWDSRFNPYFPGQENRYHLPNCRNCGKPFKPRSDANLFCSWQCYIQCPNRMEIIPKRESTRSVVNNCRFCNAPVRVPKSHLKMGKGKYCGRACYAKARRSRHAPSHNPATATPNSPAPLQATS
ncbi:hypothetical protein NTE_01856 [Candidatus Nitrososphaera evergladensis SR1]|uniref:Uncharacterized protein n=1 Tax=Candidatus Nitrososphaera evergladensis SR1 TaxID=1459636 RepID=A0A075MQU5_9ARCH|nr:hypothetical protein NTE_01856 [Candidatus Nitrososphaera evergladensis SR1]